MVVPCRWSNWRWPAWPPENICSRSAPPGAAATPRSSSASGLQADTVRWAIGLTLAFVAVLRADSAIPDATLIRFDAIVTDGRGRPLDNLRLEDLHLVD